MPLPRPLVRRFAWVGVAAAVAASVLTAAGQFRLGRNPIVDAADGAPHDDKDGPSGVTVPDSPGASERLAHAAEKVDQKLWKTAADFYREAVAQFPGRVVPESSDAATGLFRYTGVAEAVQARIARWPADGLKEYRNDYGQLAADRLAGARRDDWATLTSIFTDDFVTDAGKAAGLRLVDAYTEAGDFPAAAAVGDRLLDLHPLLGADRPTVLFRTALARHWAGDDAAADRRAGELRQLDPKAVGSVAGRDVVLADELGTLLAVPTLRPAVDPAAADTYPSFGGPGGRGDVSPSTAKPGASLNTVTLTPPELGTVAGGPQNDWKRLDQASVDAGGARGIMPVVDAGTLFFQDGRTLYAVDAESGMPVTAWLATYPGEAGGRYRLPSPGRARGEQLTVTVTPTDVLAVMGQRDRLMYGGGGGFNPGFVVQQADGPGGSPVKLVCLDRTTGRERWKGCPADLPDAAGAAKGGDYDGPPLSVPAAVSGTGDDGDGGGDSVLTVVRGGRDGQFDNCYVVCLSARTGQFRWATYIGSGARTFDGDTYFGQDPSQMALADGRVLVMSNLGTVAALDPADGRVLWLDAYRRDNAQTVQDAFRQQQLGQGGPALAGKPWARNPVVVQGGHVFALPTDSKQLMVLDAATGRQLNRIDTNLPTADGRPEQADVLLGVRDGRAVLSGRLTIFGVDWQRYTPATAAACRWVEQPWGDVDDVAAIAGRGFLTADGIYVVNGKNLSEIDWRRHKIVSVYPTTGGFSGRPGEQGPGNILVTSQNVVVAGSTRVDVYTDLAVVTAKYDAQMRAAPADPEPRVRFANALFAGGRYADALARMDQAIGLVGGRSAMRPGPGRAMIFDALLDFGRRLTQPGARAVTPDPSTSDPSTSDLAAAVFDRAADAADGPDQRVAYLLARARYADAVTHDYRAEVDLCQRVLSDAALRPVAVTDEQTAAAAAAAAIAGAIGSDPSAYAAVEARATAALADVRSRGDPDALLLVAEVYPNSHAAPDARQAAVDLYQTAGQPNRAIDVLRQMYAAASDPVVKAARLEQVAANFLAMGPDGVGPAADRLAWAGHLASFAPQLAADLTLPDGTVLRRGQGTYAEAVAGLRATLAAADAARLPDFALPSRHQAVEAYAAAHGGAAARGDLLSPFAPGGPVIAGVTSIVHPPAGFNRNDRLVTWSPSGLAVFDAGQTTPRFVAPAMTEAPLGAAWVGGAKHGRWLVWTPARLACLGDDGRSAWPTAVATDSLPPLPVVSAGRASALVDDVPAAGGDADALALQQQQQAAINGQVVFRGNARLIVQNGQIVMAPPNPVVARSVPLAGGEQVVAAQPAGPTGNTVLVSTTTGRLLAIDTADGRVLWQARPADRPVDGLLANAHFTVVRLDDGGGALLAVYDTPTGRVVGRVAFAPEGQGRPQLVNVALGEEGTLAFTRSDGIVIKDLYDPWRPDARTPLTGRGNQDPAQWLQMTQPEQLLVRAGRVVGLYDTGRYAVAYDLSRRADPTNPLPTGAASANAWVRLVGPQLFVVQPGNVKRFDLTDPAAASGPMLTAGAHVRGLLLGSDFALIVDDPVDAGPAGAPSVTLLAVSRAPVPGRRVERGDLQFVWTVNSRAGITDWIGVDGGVYLLTGDHRLHALRGSRLPS